MTGDHRVCAVVVCYNSSTIVAECLRSLRHAATTAGCMRLIVVDNASSDGTVDIVRSMLDELQPMHVEVVEAAGNTGFAGGVNVGMGRCRVDEDVLVLNPDTSVHPDFVVELLRGLDDMGAGICVPRYLDENGVTEFSVRRRPRVARSLVESLIGGTLASRFRVGEMVTQPKAYERPRRVAWATGAAFLISRECVGRIGPLDERFFLYSEETEYMLRAHRAGFDTWYVPSANLNHTGGEQRQSQALWALSVCNEVRLHREIDGSGAGASLWALKMLGSVLRLVNPRDRRRAQHLAAIRGPLTMNRWPDRGLPSGPPYVCFAAQDWWYHNRAHSDFQLMREVSSSRRVLVVNSIGMRMPLPGRSTQPHKRIVRKLKSVGKFLRRPLPDRPDFWVLSPIPLPFYEPPIVRRLAAMMVRLQVKAALQLLGMSRPVAIVTIPTAASVVAGLQTDQVVFNRSDSHASFPEADRSVIEGMENELLASSHMTLYASRALMAEESTACRNPVFLDHGVDYAHFAGGASAPVPPEFDRIPEPRVGFFGALDSFVVDFDLIERLAREMPKVSVVLIGSTTEDTERLAQHPNVFLLGFRPYQDLPAFGARFDVALMPWQRNQWIQYSNPIKLKEYLALGLPIVTTHFAEVEYYRDVVSVAEDENEFIDLVRESLGERHADEDDRRQRSVATLSWAEQASKLTRLVEENTL